MQANNYVEAIWRGNLKNCRGRIICFATVSIWYRGSSINLVSVVVLVRVGFLFITEQKNFFFLHYFLFIWIESIATDPSTVMFVTYAWTNVLKENISADLIRDTMNAAFVWRWSLSVYGVNKHIRDHMCSNDFLLCDMFSFTFYLFFFFITSSYCSRRS